MGFIHGLISAIDGAPNSQMRAASQTAEWLKYAPPRVRSQRASQDLRQLESENRHWRERARQAEARLKSIESSIQRIAQQVDPPRPL